MPNDPALLRFTRAVSLGKPALLCLRAEGLLGHADDGEIPLTPEEREKLERISVAPHPADEEFLRDFDRYLEADRDDDSPA